MKVTKAFLFACVLSGASLVVAQQAGRPAVVPTDLRCESRTNPLAVEPTSPRFSWQIPTGGGGQTAYRLLVASSPELLAKGEGDLWDSGKVASDLSFQVPYAGKALNSEAQAFWRVQLWDRAQQPITSNIATFSMGLLKPTDWQAKWIGFPNDTSTRASEPAPCFRKEFAVAKPVARATVHICGLGQYELTLNGQKVGDAELGPAWTTYAKTCSYDSFDVTRQLSQGANAVGIMLGNGMYNVIRAEGRYSKFNGSLRTGTLALPKALMQLDIEYADGTRAQVVTDGTWKTARGPVVFNHTYGGEDYDARREMPGWDAPKFNDGSWVAAVEVPAPGDGQAKMVAAVNPPIKIQKSFKPVKVMQPVPGVWVYDMGQNLSGWPHIKVKGPAGATVEMVPTELLYRDGTVGGVVSANRGLNWYSYTLKGSGEEEWRPRFGSYGYRYIQVTGAKPPAGTVIAPTETGGIGRQAPPLGTIAPATAELTDIQSEWVYADIPTDGTFLSSDVTLNRIHKLINAAILSNAQSVLTDCPHREKIGWLEQAQLMADSIALNYDMSGLYAKICMDIRDVQYANGTVPTIAPEYKIDPNESFQNSPEWGAAAFVAPWVLYQYYGDTRSLETQYDSMKRYLDYLGTRAEGHILSMGLGDWMEVGSSGPPKNTTRELTGTATFYQDAKIMQRTAEVLRRTDDAKAFAALAEQIRVAFNAKFFNPQTSQYEKGSQTANAMPLALGMVDPDKRAAVANNLVEGIRTNKYQVTAGDVGFVYVVNALIDAGQGEVMYQMLTQSTGPGYVMQLNKGATTLTEKWDGGNSSNNHLMLGHGELWFYRGLTGIQAGPDNATFQRFTIRPQVVEKLAPDVDGKVFANATYRSVRGLVESGWSLKGKQLTMNATVPPTSTATIYVPAANPASVKVTPAGGGAAAIKLVRTENQVAVYTAEAGSYQFESVLP